MSRRVVLVGVGGASCGGKSTLTEWLAKLLNIPIVHQDRHYKTDSEIPVIDGVQHWDCPESLDMDSFVKCLQDVKSGAMNISILGDNRPVISDNDIPSEDRPGLDAASAALLAALTAASGDNGSMDLVLVDGFLLFDDPRVLQELDVLIFLHAPYQVLKSRRDSRAGYVTLEGYWADPPNYFEKFVWPAYIEFNRLPLDAVARLGPDHPVGVSDIAVAASSTTLAVSRKLFTVDTGRVGVARTTLETVEYLTALVAKQFQRG